MQKRSNNDSNLTGQYMEFLSKINDFEKLKTNHHPRVHQFSWTLLSTLIHLNSESMVWLCYIQDLIVYVIYIFNCQECINI